MGRGITRDRRRRSDSREWEWHTHIRLPDPFSGPMLEVELTVTCELCGEWVYADAEDGPYLCERCDDVVNDGGKG